MKECVNQLMDRDRFFHNRASRNECPEFCSAASLLLLQAEFPLAWAPSLGSSLGRGGCAIPIFHVGLAQGLFVFKPRQTCLSVGSRALTLLEKPFSAAGQVYEYPWGPWVS